MAQTTHGANAAGMLLRERNLRYSSPKEYSRLLRLAHESVIGGAVEPNVPAGLVESWRRSLALGINPDQHRPRHLHEVADVVALRREHRLHPVMTAVRDLLADDDAPHLLVLTDADGEVLWRVGSRSVLRRADGLEFVEGADWSEAGVGTNAISQVLSTRQPVQLFSAEHLVRTHHDWACTAAPITDPVTGQLLGVLDVSGPLESLSLDTLRMVRCAARVAEEVLRKSAPAVEEPRRVSSAAPARAVESIVLLGDKPAVAFDDGSRAPLTLRRAEILALLGSRSRGWTADELAYELHGETGAPATVRIEMHRVRATLGDAIASNPYCLTGSAAGSSDAGRVLRLLHKGRISEALDAYPAPLLPRSTSMAVELLRDRLDLAVGSAVRAGRDTALILRWLGTDMGAEDIEAIEALGLLVGRKDPRYLAFRARAEAAERASDG